MKLLSLFYHLLITVDSGTNLLLFVSRKHSTKDNNNNNIYHYTNSYEKSRTNHRFYTNFLCESSKFSEKKCSYTSMAVVLYEKWNWRKKYCIVEQTAYICIYKHIYEYNDELTTYMPRFPSSVVFAIKKEINKPRFLTDEMTVNLKMSFYNILYYTLYYTYIILLLLRTCAYIYTNVESPTLTKSIVPEFEKLKMA